MIPKEAIEAAIVTVREDLQHPLHWAPRRIATRVLNAAAPFLRAQALEDAAKLIRDLTDRDDCRFDHHGGCQAHGYLSLEPGEKCPQQEAKEFVRAVTERGEG